MRIDLKTISTINDKAEIHLTNRLPSHLIAPIHLHCNYTLSRYDNYFLLAYRVFGRLNICCQRCAKPFKTDYAYEAELALCKSEAVAESILSHYEAIVATASVDLSEIITDELYFSTPSMHSNLNDCDTEKLNLS